MNVSDAMFISIRAENALHRAGIDTVEQLANTTWAELEKMQNIGTKTMCEICWAYLDLHKAVMLEKYGAYTRATVDKRELEELREKAAALEGVQRIIYGLK